MAFSITERADGDTFDAGVYNGDRQQIVDFIEAQIEPAILAIKQAIDPSVTAWDDNTVTGPLGIANVKHFGALGDGSTDDITAIRAAVASFSTTGGTLYFPPGTYMCSNHIAIPYSNIIIQGAGVGASIIKAKSGFAAATRGVLALGYDTSYTPAAVSNIGVRDIRVDGNDYSWALVGNSLTNALIQGVLAENSLRAPAQFYTCTDLAIDHCVFQDSNATDQFGDGLYLQACIRPKITNNYVYDFTRIGIVCEGTGGATTHDAIITGNHVRYGHNNTSPEYIGGIWCEHTDNAVIANNHISDLTNTIAGGTYSRGITCSVNADNASCFTVVGNIIRDCEHSIALYPDSDMSMNVTGNVIVPGAVTVAYGISLYGRGNSINISDNVFHSMIYKTNGSAILIDDALSDIETVIIANNALGTNTYSASGSTDLNLYNLGSVNHLSLSNLEEWHLIHNTTGARYLKMTNCAFIYNSDTSGIFKARVHGFATNCTFTQSGGTASSGIMWYAGAYLRFSNCLFVGVKSTLSNDSATQVYMTFDNCKFTSSCLLTISGSSFFELFNCLFDTWASTGVIIANGVNRTLQMFINDCRFTETHDYTPMKLGSFAPTVLLISNAIRSTVITNLTDMTATAGAVYTVTSAAP